MFIKTKEYEQIQSLQFGMGSDEKGNFCVVLTINGKIYIAALQAAKDIISGLQEVIKVSES